MDEKWIIVNEEVRRPGAVSTIAVSREFGADFFMATRYLLLFLWGYSFNFSNRQHTESVSFHIYSPSVQEEMMSAYSYLLETPLTDDN